MAARWGIEELSAVILAAGSLGVSAFGIVEGLKWTPLGTFGFGRVVRLLGELTSALKVAYGREWRALIRAQFRRDRIGGDLARTLRQGVRAGLTGGNAEEMATFLELGDPPALAETAEALEKGTVLSDKQRNLLGRFELAADARIDAALCLGDSAYVGAQRVAAGFFALILALVAASVLEPPVDLGFAALIGVAAVPLAPIAKDVVSALQEAQNALRARR